MKGLILAAGMGKRFNSESKVDHKCLVRLDDMFLLENSIIKIAKIKEIEECIVVVGYNAKEIIENIGSTIDGVKIVYCKQQKLNGIVGAIKCALPYIGDEDVMMQLGDEFYGNPRFDQGIDSFYQYDYDCLVGTLKSQDMDLIKNNYTFDFDENGMLTKFEEKPKKPFNDYLGTGHIIIKNTMFPLIHNVPVNAQRGEPDLVGFLECIAKSNKIGYYTVSEQYVNINTISDYHRLKELKKKMKHL